MNSVYFLLLLFAIYLVSRSNINSLYVLTHHLLHRHKPAYLLIALIFYPGTVLHEFSHVAGAIVLGMEVKGIQLFPVWEEGRLRLGSVSYIKKDPVRALIVGIFPFFGGLLFFLALELFRLFPGTTLIGTAVVGYLIFAISSTMFSSRQDLKDIIVALPVILLACAIIYLILGLEWTGAVVPYFNTFFAYLNIYLLFCLIIHIILLAVFKLTGGLLKIRL